MHPALCAAGTQRTFLAASLHPSGGPGRPIADIPMLEKPFSLAQVRERLAPVVG
jgi:hypothetical protein